MSMLAEKRRREKWSINPRGKAWSDDQNKFGQRLMEKMGWKSGQGLGVNSQGQTEIVKARVKNDSKGLGFKENGEEWLKTTSDFDNLLEELASSREDSGDGSQSEAPVSLEDRSKNSRARVHYHKFTRGKDLSRYSEKDLASIIGPEVVKLKTEHGSTKSDYTQNQVNKGSIEEYFSNKSKSRGSKSEDNELNHENSYNLEESFVNSESKNVNESSESLVLIPIKKKKKKTIECPEMKENSIHIENNEGPDVQTNSKTKVLEKKNKKRKSFCDIEDKLQELEGSDENGLNSVKSGFLKNLNESEFEAKMDEAEQEFTNKSSDAKKSSKKRKINHEDLSVDIETQDTNNSKQESLSKKKQKNIGEKTEQYVYNASFTNNSSITIEPVANEENVPKKKKKKHESQEYHEGPYKFNEKTSVDDSDEIVKKKKRKKSENNCLDQRDIPSKEKIEPYELVAEETVVNYDNLLKKKKKSKEKNMNHESVPSEVHPECNVKATNNNHKGAEETTGYDELIPKKKKKKTKDVQNEAIVELDIDSKPTGAIESSCGQILSHNKSGNFLEVLGRRTRLKKIRTIPKNVTDDTYQTEEFMFFSKIDNSKKENTNVVGIKSKDDNRNFVQSVAKSLQKATEGNKVEGKKFGVSSKVSNSKEFVKDEQDNSFKFYAEPNNEDCTVPKHVVAYEYRLVTSRLKRLEIPQPEVKVVIKEATMLNETTRRKLKQLAKIRHLKTLLPPDIINEVDTLVTKFHDSLKPKIEIMSVIAVLDEKILDIVKNLDENPEIKASEKEATYSKSMLSERVDALTNLFQKLETLLESYRKTKDESCTSEDNIKANSDGLDKEDLSETRSSWLKKVENKLDIIKSHITLLAKGIGPPDLSRELQTTENKKKSCKKSSSIESKNKYFTNTNYSRGRIAHNVRNERGTRRGFGRGQPITKNSFPSGGWGMLKSYGSGKEGYENKQHLSSVIGNVGSFNKWARDFSYGGGFRHGRGLAGRGLRGRGRGDMRGRGRISQNNFDAKLYAEQCKELNKVPEVCFNGVNMKVICGYPANASVEKTSLSNEDSTLLKSNLSGKVSKESLPDVRTTKKVLGEFSEVVVRKDG